jgi:hypothetical protein
MVVVSSIMLLTAELTKTEEYIAIAVDAVGTVVLIYRAIWYNPNNK